MRNPVLDLLWTILNAHWTAHSFQYTVIGHFILRVFLELTFLDDFRQICTSLYLFWATVDSLYNYNNS